MTSATFRGACARCKETIVVEFVVVESGTHRISPPPVIGSYHECGDKTAPGGLTGQAVPLTLDGLPE